MVKMASTMVSMTMLLMVWTATAQTRCLDPNTNDGERCSNGECRITGARRRDTSRVAAKFCHEGEYKSVWYQTSTTEAQCNATPTASSIIASTLPADYTGSDASMTDAENLAAQSGQCYSPRRRRGSMDTTEYGYKYTCTGIANTNPPVRMVFQSATCAAANFTRNHTTWQAKINDQPAPCFCHWSNKVQSECSKCDKDAEHQCSTQALCDAASYNRCSWSGNSCTCVSGNYQKMGVCVGGALHDFFYQSSSYSACKAAQPVAGSYLKFPTNSRRRGGATSCQAQSGTWHNGSEGISYTSQKDYDCTGVADFGEPRRTYFNGTACATSNMVGWDERHRRGYDDCGCMSPLEQVRSECTSCGGTECSTKDACMMSREGRCAWNSANTAGSQCSCSTGVFKSQQHCWGGLPADIWYEGANGLSRCTAGSTDATFHRAKDVSDDGSWGECSTNYDASEQGTHVKRAVCDGVANGKAAVRGYYNDASCTNLNHSKANPNPENTCSCELYNGCKAGTTFEKYICSGVGGPVTAVEYSDGLCTTKTGVTRSLSSITDAMNLNVCGAWPPIALQPNFDASLILKCPAANVNNMTGVAYKYFERVNKDSMTPTCTPVAPATEAEHGGNLSDCFCKDELMFNAIALEKNVQISGQVTLTVSDVAAAVQDVTFKKIVKSTIAESAGVSPNNIVDLTLTAARRLNAATSATPRMLASGSVKAEYLIVVPKTIESAVKSSITSTTVSALSTTIANKVSSAPSVTFTASVTAKTPPQSAPATVAVSTSGTIAKQGVDPSGAANPGSAGSSDHAFGTPSGLLIMAALSMVFLGTCSTK